MSRPKISTSQLISKLMVTSVATLSTDGLGGGGGGGYLVTEYYWCAGHQSSVYDGTIAGNVISRSETGMVSMIASYM